MKRRISIATAALLALAAPGVAAARGVVLRADADRAFVDIGAEAGAARGSLMTLYHVIEVEHPVSGKKVRDTFPLGKLRVIQAAARISVVAVPEPLRDRIAVGDEVELASEPVAWVDPWTRPQNDAADGGGAARARAVAAAEKKVGAAREVESVWRATLGETPARRVELWKSYLAKHPQSAYAAAVRRAVTELESRVAEEARGEGRSPEKRLAAAQLAKLQRLSRDWSGRGGFFYHPPRRAGEGEPLELAFLVGFPETVRSAWLYYRPAGRAAFERVRLVSGGDATLVARIPGDAVRPPHLDYFVEALRSDGAEPEAVLGDHAAPLRVAVAARPRPSTGDRRGRSRISTFLDYVDFDGLSAKNDNDEYVHGEIDFMYRFRLPWVYSLRLGFGTMSGRGGPKDVIDADPEGCLDDQGRFRCRRVGYNYAYAEIEWKLGDAVGVALRPQWGSVFRDRAPMENVDREFFDAFGLRARLRLGREDDSNLLIGASATQALGKLFEAAFNWAVIPEVPLVFSVQVTDQPVIEDFGVRLIGDVGWRHYSWFYPSLRLAYQARDIDHAGPSAGLAMNFDW